jgi:hypothetical protein
VLPGQSSALDLRLLCSSTVMYAIDRARCIANADNFHERKAGSDGS